jgi:hypothetical protein
VGQEDFCRRFQLLNRNLCHHIPLRELICRWKLPISPFRVIDAASDEAVTHLLRRCILEESLVIKLVGVGLVVSKLFLMLFQSLLK